MPIPIPSRADVDCISTNEESCDQLEMLGDTLQRTAAQLVEALIEGKISDRELETAHSLLLKGDNTADRSILVRLSEGGIDATDTMPLLPDLDAYYEMLKLAEEATAMEEAV